jgi:hypothetical protein
VPYDRKVLFQDMMRIPGTKKRDYVVEISMTKTKLMIVAARKNKHYKLELPKKQGKRLLYDICGGSYELATLVRISKSETLYIEGLKDLLNMNAD